MKLIHNLLPFLYRHFQPFFLRCLALLDKGLQLGIVHGGVLSKLGLVEEVFHDYLLFLGKEVEQTVNVSEHTKDILYL